MFYLEIQVNDMAGSALKRLMAEYKRECGYTESVEWLLVA